MLFVDDAQKWAKVMYEANIKPECTADVPKAFLAVIAECDFR